MQESHDTLMLVVSVFTCNCWFGTCEDLSGADSVPIESNKPSKRLVPRSSELPSCCLDCEGAMAEGIGEDLELFMTVLGLIGGLGVRSLGTERGAGGSEKSKADGILEDESV